MNCFIIDDDDTTRLLIEDMIGKISGVAVSGSFRNPLEVLEKYIEQKPDLIILDVEMPEISGVEFAQGIDSSTKIIFISSKKDYAVDAFSLNAADYILKPVTLPRITQAMLRVKKDIQENHDAFFLKTNDGYQRVEASDLTYIEALGDYVQIYSSTNKFILNGTLKAVESKLSKKEFLRVHRSYIVNLKKVEKIEEGSIIIGKKLIPVGRSYKKEFTERINTLDL